MGSPRRAYPSPWCFAFLGRTIQVAFPLGYLTNAVLRSYTAHILLALPPLLVGAVVFLLKNPRERGVVSLFSSCSGTPKVAVGNCWGQLGVATSRTIRGVRAAYAWLLPGRQQPCNRRCGRSSRESFDTSVENGSLLALELVMFTSQFSNLGLDNRHALAKCSQQLVLGRTHSFKGLHRAPPVLRRGGRWYT